MNYSIVTIDTEAWHGDRPVDRLIWGESKDGLHGIEDLMDIFDNEGIKALFFLDFAECWDYGDEAIFAVAHRIEERGHTVGMHVHPDHMADPQREFLWQYSRDEQFEILSQVTDKYVAALGRRPVFFRAGKYAVNYDTLDILSELGYKYDFSAFYGRDWCALTPPLTADYVCEVRDLLEVPVTSFVGLRIGPFERIDKVDLEMSPCVLRYVVKKFSEKNEGQIISLFGHSFSFVGNRYAENMDELFFDEKMYQNFASAIEYVNSLESVRILSPEEFVVAARHSGEFKAGPNATPSVVVKNPLMALYYLYSTAWRIRSFNKKASWLIAGSGCAALAVLLAVGLFALVY